MAIIKITKQDILKSQPPKEGWYKASISDYTTGRSSKGDSVNIVLKFAFDENDREMEAYFNTKAIGRIISVVEAATGVKIESDNGDFDLDLDSLKGKKLDVKVSPDTYEGRIVMKINDYAPYGTGSSDPAF